MESPTRSGEIGFHQVDDSGLAPDLVRTMRETAAWPAVVQLRELTRPALESARRGGAVLDAGCGLADVLIDLKAARPDLRCVGVDLSVAMLDAARADAEQRGVEVELQTRSADELDFGDEEFDIVRTERMLQWVPDPAATIRELVRVLRPGGTLVAIDTDWRTATIELGDVGLEREMTSAFSSRPSAGVGGRLRHLALDAGLEGVREYAVAALLTDWDPDERPAPPGFLPPDAVQQMLTGTGVVSSIRAEQIVEAYERTARAGRFRVSTTMVAIVGHLPA